MAAWFEPLEIYGFGVLISGGFLTCAMCDVGKLRPIRNRKRKKNCSTGARSLNDQTKTFKQTLMIFRRVTTTTTIARNHRKPIRIAATGDLSTTNFPQFRL